MINIGSIFEDAIYVKTRMRKMLLIVLMMNYGHVILVQFLHLY